MTRERGARTRRPLFQARLAGFMIGERQRRIVKSCNNATPFSSAIELDGYSDAG